MAEEGNEKREPEAITVSELLAPQTPNAEVSNEGPTSSDVAFGATLDIADVASIKSVDLSGQKLGRDTYRLPNITLSKDAAAGSAYLRVVWPAGVVTLKQKTDFGDGAGFVAKTEDGFKVVPLVDVSKGGTWTFTVPAILPSGDEFLFPFMLTANPDSQTLWKVQNPPEKDWLFPEDRNRIASDHKTKLMLDTGFVSLGVSRRGRYHELGATFRDDSIGMWSDEETGRYVYIVADGAGSAKYSREGSRRLIATLVDAEKGKLAANLKSELWDKDPEDAPRAVGDMLIKLSFYAVKQLGEYITEENKTRSAEPLTMRDFSTTFLIAALKKDKKGQVRIVTFSVGDGAIALFDGENVDVMCEPDGDKFSGGTRFMTMPEVWESYKNDPEGFRKQRVFYKKLDKIAAAHMTLFMMSDGVSDPKFGSDAGLHDASKWAAFSNEIDAVAFADKEPLSESADKLIEWLHFWMKGEYDDRSLFVVKDNPKYKFRKGLVKKVHKLATKIIGGEDA